MVHIDQDLFVKVMNRNNLRSLVRLPILSGMVELSKLKPSLRDSVEIISENKTREN